MSEECDRICRIFTRVEHEDIEEAIISDLIDAIPILGDISTFMRARNISEDKYKELKLALLAFDFVTNLLPFGDIFDLLVPANTLSFLISKSRINLP